MERRSPLCRDFTCDAADEKKFPALCIDNSNSSLRQGSA
jgi:hypothetical protein